MKRKDGRELVTEHPVTGTDMIDYIPRGELTIPEGALGCRLAGIDTGSSGDEDPSSEDFDDWGARPLAHILPTHCPRAHSSLPPLTPATPAYFRHSDAMARQRDEPRLLLGVGLVVRDRQGRGHGRRRLGLLGNAGQRRIR